MLYLLASFLLDPLLAISCTKFRLNDPSRLRVFRVNSRPLDKIFRLVQQGSFLKFKQHFLSFGVETY